jgi:hypothetical protein
MASSFWLFLLFLLQPLAGQQALMETLNLPTYSFSVKSEAGRNYIFDIIRKKYIVLSPEEWVRQNFIRYLVSEKKFPASLITVEQQFIFNKMQKRTDILVYNNQGDPVVLVECKAPSVPITKSVFDQIGLYNLTHHVPWLMVTNGIKHYCCQYVEAENKYQFTDFIPEWSAV